MKYQENNEAQESKKKYFYGNTEVEMDPGGEKFVRTEDIPEQAAYIFAGNSLLYSRQKNTLNFQTESKVKKFNIEYITSASKRKVTFSKRKKGLLKKAKELDVLTGANILCIVVNENGEASMYYSENLKLLADNCKKYLIKTRQEQSASDDFVCFE